MNITSLIKQLFIIALLLFARQVQVQSQTLLTGTIRTNNNQPIPTNSVKLTTSSGRSTYSNASGKYKILVESIDTIRFFYQQKLIDAYPFNKFISAKIYDVTLSIGQDEFHQLGANELETVHVNVSRYSSDSILTRKRYKNVFNYSKPTLKAGDNRFKVYIYFMGDSELVNTMDKKLSLLDLQSLAQVLSFKKNKKKARYQQFALEMEQRNYVKQRFTKDLVEKYSGIHDEDSIRFFIQKYAPSYSEINYMSDFELFQYIIDKSKLYRKKRK